MGVQDLILASILFFSVIARTDLSRIHSVNETWRVDLRLCLFNIINPVAAESVIYIAAFFDFERNDTFIIPSANSFWKHDSCLCPFLFCL